MKQPFNDLLYRQKPNMSSVVRAAGKGNLCMLKVLANNCTPGEEATELMDEASGNNILHILLDVKLLWSTNHQVYSGLFKDVWPT